jgi:gluconate 2-dehydrogenase gamma chain
MGHRWSRRAVLRGGAVVGAVTALPPRVLAQAEAEAPYSTLTPVEAATLEAIVSRLIPADASGPGALEAGAVRYIDAALRAALSSLRPTYAAGLSALDAYARNTAGASFAALPPERQDAVLTDVEQNRATGFTAASGVFFDLVLGHTLEGTFGDPSYGGNRDFIGWELLGYPGLRLAVTAEQQVMDPNLPPDYQSAYDHAMFEDHSTEGARDDD